MDNYNDYNVIIYLDKIIDYIQLEGTTEKMAISVANEAFNSRTNADKVMVIDKNYKIVYTKEDIEQKRGNNIMMTEKEVYLYDMLVELNIATEEELNLAFNITDMCWLDTLTRVLYARTGYRSLEQYLEEEEEE